MSHDPKPQVNIAVPGVFHFRHYIRHVESQGVLNRFYYSHRWSTSGSELGVPHEKAVNLFMKEYLTHGHLSLINHRLGNVAFPLYLKLWESQVIGRWSECELTHVLIHGAAPRLIRHAQRRKSLVLGELVNAHPTFVQELMHEEYDRLGISAHTVKTLNRGQKTMLEEAAAADFLLAPSRFVMDSYIRNGTDPTRMFLEPYGTDLSRFHPGERRDDGIFRVLCVAQVSPRKGHIDLIRAWEMLNLHYAELVFIGAMTPEMERVLSNKRHLFTYRGTVPHNKLTEEFHQADVVVLPSIEDGFSVVPLEAMACGVPVIVSQNAGVSELIREGETGFVVPIRSPESIAALLESLKKYPGRRMSIGEAVAAQVHASNSWATYSLNLCRLYRIARSEWSG